MLQVVDLRQVVERDVGLRRIAGQVILMVALRRIEGMIRFDLRRDWLPEYVGLIELFDVGLGDTCLFGGRGEDR